MAVSSSIWVGALVGYTASRMMDHATTWFYQRQSEASRQREDEIAPGGTLVQLGKQLGDVAGRELDDTAAGRLGLAVHRTFGMGYGMAAWALARRGLHPMAAGMAVGAAAWVLVDEGTSLPLFTAYPLESHLRGVVGHGAYGLAAGALLTVVMRD